MPRGRDPGPPPGAPRAPAAGARPPRRDPGRAERDPRGSGPGGRDPRGPDPGWAGRGSGRHDSDGRGSGRHDSGGRGPDGSGWDPERRAGRGADPGAGPRTRQMPAQPGAVQPGAAQPAIARRAGEPPDARGRRSAQRPQGRGRGRWGALQGGLGVCIIVASAAVGTIATMVARSKPGLLLGLFVVAGTVVAALAVRPRAGRMILPVPVLSYLVAALISGVVYSRPAVTSKTALAIGAAQWIADGFFAMALATVLAVAITTARWYLWRRRRPVTRDPGWPVPVAGSAPAGTGPVPTGRAAPPRRPRSSWESSAESGHPAGLAGPGGLRETGKTDTPGTPGGLGNWGDAVPRTSRRPEPRPGTGPYNFSSGA